MKSPGLVAALLVSLFLVQGCSTVRHDTADTAPAAARTITVSGLENGATRVVVSTDAAFDYGSIVLRPAVASELLAAVQPHLQQRVTISGFTDNVGAATYNLMLSRERAQAIASELLLHGGSAGRMTVSGYGEDNPRASNETEAGRRLNRRVELLFKSVN